MKRKPHTALYGNVSIPRVYCSFCDSYAFVIDTLLQCCERTANEELPAKIKRMSDCYAQRNRPTKKSQDEILKSQEHCCFYCFRAFGKTVYRNSRSIRLQLHWDHINPYVYSLDNRDQNFVAACHVCNGIKSDTIFKGADDARIYITERWKDKGYSDVPPVSIRLHTETALAEVL